MLHWPPEVLRASLFASFPSFWVTGHPHPCPRAWEPRHTAVLKAEGMVMGGWEAVDTGQPACRSVPLQWLLSWRSGGGAHSFHTVCPGSLLQPAGVPSLAVCGFQMVLMSAWSQCLCASGETVRRKKWGQWGCLPGCLPLAGSASESFYLNGMSNTRLEEKSSPPYRAKVHFF